MLQLGLRTECVVNQARIVVPMFARVYSTDLYLHENKVLNYNELVTAAGAKFRGTSHHDNIQLWEVWEDGGLDGHVQYHLTGYVFVPERWVKRTYGDVIAVGVYPRNAEALYTLGQDG